MWKWIVGGIAILFALFLYRIVTGIRRSLKLGNDQLAAALLELKPEDLPRLVRECQEFFRSAIAADLDPANWQDAAMTMDDALKDRQKCQKILRALSREEVAYYWVLPMGAFLGQLLERHANAQWKFDAGAPPFMEISAGGGEMTIWPFDKVRKHIWEGDAGDLVAYVHTNVNLEQMVAQLEQLEDPLEDQEDES